MPEYSFEPAHLKDPLSALESPPLSIAISTYNDSRYLKLPISEHLSEESSNMETEAGRLDKPTVLDDAASLYSYTSTKDVSQFVKEFHGRVFNNTNASYLLPADQAEWARLDKQGSALTIAFDGLYPCQDIVDAVLLPEEGCSKRILDVGCGTGAWALQMAIKFPHTSVLGIDVAPTPIDEASFPPNLSLQICDINLGLRHFEGQIDLLHMRCVAGGIHDMTQMLQELQRCLKPGGLLLVVDGDSSTLCEDRKTIMPLKRLPDDGGPEITGVSRQGSWLRRVLWEAREACQIAGSDLTRADTLYDLGLWDHPLCDPDTARSGGVDLPIGPWAKTEDVVETQLLKYAGTVMRQNLLSIHRAYHAILLNHGMDQETLDEWSRHVDEELNTLDPKGWIRSRFFMARRRAGDRLPAPPLPTSPLTVMGSQALVGQQRSTRSRYPAIDVYYTREDNLRRMQQRRSGYGVFPPSAVGKAWAKKQAGL